MTPEHSCARSHNSNGDLTLLRQHERLPEFRVVPGEESQASRRNSRQAMRFPSTRNDALFSCTASRAIPNASQNSRGGLTPFMQLKGAQRSPYNSRWKTSFPPQLRGASCVPPYLEMRTHSLLQLKRNANFPSHRKRRPVSPIESRVESHGSCYNEKGRRVPSLLQISPDSPALAPMEHGLSPHSRMGGLSPLPMLLKKPKFPNIIRPEAWHPFENSRGTQSSMPHTRRGLTPLLNLDKKPKHLALPFCKIGRRKADLFQYCGTTEFSKFAGILSVALWWHNLRTLNSSPGIPWPHELFS